MLRREPNVLLRPLDGIDLISTDVFDTLLLRRARSRGSRLFEAERCFGRVLRQEGFDRSVEEQVRARLLAERFAYRALNVGGGKGEVRLYDVIERQLTLLGLPSRLAEYRVDIELAIEKKSLVANAALARALDFHRQAGIRVVAISDTGLSGANVAELIEHFHGNELISTVYSSADLGSSKRFGGLFSDVLALERVPPSRVLHVGDDEVADMRIPTAMGIGTVHVPRSGIHRSMSRFDGACSQAANLFGRKDFSTTRSTSLVDDERYRFGRDVFGPIVAQFSLHLWLYASQASQHEDSVMAFCARGGIGMRAAFERLLGRLQLPLSVARHNLLVSRLVAARTAVETRSGALLDELSREFADGSFKDVAAALGGGSYDLPAGWDDRFDASRFFALLETVGGMPVLADITEQNRLFKEHLDAIAKPAARIVLCDTGLYGSTQRLLAAGLPGRRIETVQFARCNYKGLSEHHFSRVVGLSVERNLYSPLAPESVVLRYWQLIESLFEPAVASVRTLFRSPDGSVSANCGPIGYGELDPSAGNSLLSGALDYVDRADNGTEILREADVAWSRLKRAIANPSSSDLTALNVGARSVDFGKNDLVYVLQKPSARRFVSSLGAMKSQLWREGAIAQEFPRLKPALLLALEAAHILRIASAGLGKRHTRRPPVFQDGRLGEHIASAKSALKSA